MEQSNEVEILLVEDNAQDAELMVRTLRKSGLSNPLVTVEDGVEALDFLFSCGNYSGRNGSRGPRVVFLDLKLPKLNGLEVLREIKKNELTRSIPVVVVTSSCEDPDIKAAYALGANSYVVKPVEFEGFCEAVTKLGLYWLLVNQPPR